MAAHEEDGGEEETGGVIRRLPEEVVHRIAAGEVVVSAAAALKELLENCIDAGATTISVSARQGGMKSLQVVDNGKGISLQDMPLLCERFATSKLHKFEDLGKVSTFGFRGEALASISHVARVTVTSMTPDHLFVHTSSMEPPTSFQSFVLLDHQSIYGAKLFVPAGGRLRTFPDRSPDTVDGAVCAYRAHYTDGKLVDGKDAGPTPCAGVPGTQITVEDLFYNLPQRRRALRSASEEYRAITDTVARYSIRYANIAFSCRKVAENASVDIRTNKDASDLDNIRLAFGKPLSQELLSVEFHLPREKISGNGWISNANFRMKRRVFILFIAGRLVDHTPLKRIIDAIYAQFSPKGTYPFCYLNIHMDPENVDVNVHPTKKEVRFLHADAMMDKLRDVIVDKLKTSLTSRMYYAQTLLRSESNIDSGENALAPALTTTTAKAVDMGGGSACHHHDEDDATIESGALDDENDTGGSNRASATMAASGGSTGKKTMRQDGSAVGSRGGERESAALPSPYKDPRKLVRTDARTQTGAMDLFLDMDSVASKVARIRNDRSQAQLTSVQNLLARCANCSTQALSDLFREHAFVGVADAHHVLIQHRTRLLMVDLESLVKELMYQRILLQFGDLVSAKLEPPLPIVLIAEKALHLPSSRWREEDGERQDVARAVASVLFSHAEMLLEYFGMHVTGEDMEDCAVAGLPVVLQGYSPQPDGVPDLILRLGTTVNWHVEEECFRDITELLASFYARPWRWDEEDTAGVTAFERTVQHTLLAATRADFEPPGRFVQDAVVQEVTSVERLYRTFERC